jgi:hypothetical protein
LHARTAAIGTNTRACTSLKAIDDFSLRVDVMDPTFEELREDSRFAHVRERLRIAGR